MLKCLFHIISVLAFMLSFTIEAAAVTDRYRVMWRDDPATTMVVGWNQATGSGAMVYYDTANHGRKPSDYANQHLPDKFVISKGMNNHFARLSGLTPNTLYYFIIKDNEGVSQVMSFKTTPADANAKLSIVAGGDSRNNRAARQSANTLVSKLRPHFVMFGGDMTGGDTASEWLDWMEDWQLTNGEDGRLFPIVTARGNHEKSNKTIEDLFDVPSNSVYYGLTFGQDLLRIYTLNSLIASGGDQKSWLAKDLANHGEVRWKMAQYHHTIRPHTLRKPEQNNLLFDWATLFHKYGVNLVVESDAHVVKSTWPIRPSTEDGSAEGFIRDDDTGTVYVGEGCWGAPLRENNDVKVWTRASESFNQFKWIHVSADKIDVRTIKTDGSDGVLQVNDANPFQPPYGLRIWKPSNGSGRVITIKKPGKPVQEPEEDAHLANKLQVDIFAFQAAQDGEDIRIEWSVANEPDGMLYEIQRSMDGGENFKTIKETRGTGGKEQSYFVLDEQLIPKIRGKARLLYRLKRTTPNGQSKILSMDGSEMDIELPKEEVVEEAPKEKPVNVVKRPPPLKKVDLRNPANWAPFPKLVPNEQTGKVQFGYRLYDPCTVTIQLLNIKFGEVSAINLANQAPEKYLKAMDITDVPAGRYLLLVRANGEVIRRFRVVKY